MQGGNYGASTNYSVGFQHLLSSVLTDASELPVRVPKGLQQRVHSPSASPAGQLAARELLAPLRRRCSCMANRHLIREMTGSVSPEKRTYLHHSLLMICRISNPAAKTAEVSPSANFAWDKAYRKGDVFQQSRWVNSQRIV
jgi:hypothetical protein